MTVEWVIPALAIAWLSFAPNAYLFARGLPYLGRRWRAAASPPRRMIIQVTTAGGSPDVVDGILDTVRGYHLGLPIELWVVAEEGDPHAYRCDRVVRVPRSFRTARGTLYKARALEYARLLRASEAVTSLESRVLFLDDDSLPSAAYIRGAFFADVDIAHGSITIRRGAGGSILPYVADHYRTADCVGTCPRYCSRGDVKVVHGEGLVCTAAVEQAVGWDWGQGKVGNKAEDLLFGRRACRLGFRYGYLAEPLYIVSPLTLRELFLQRRRWLWNILSSWRDIDPPHRLFVLGRFGVGFVGIFAAFLTFYIPLTGSSLPLWLSVATGCTTAAFLSFYGFGAWRNTRRRLEVAKALALAWPASLVEAAILVISLIRPPHGFHVVRKALPTVPEALTAPRGGGVAWTR